jgi:hypothetical protein
MLGRKRDPLEAVNVLELTPARVAESEDVQGRIVLARPAPTTTGLRGAIDRVLNAMSAKRIRLDEHGSFVWRHLDGERTVGDIARLTRAEFGDAVEPAEERVGKLVQVMHREGLVDYEVVGGGERW